MTRYAPTPTVGGGVIPGGLPKGVMPQSGKANGLNVRGVVLVLTGFGEPSPPLQAAQAVYASVLCYGRLRCVLPRVLVTQPHGGPQSGRIGGIRPSSIAIGEGGALNPDFASPADCDGSHVIVSFLDDDLALPYISAVIPHPKVDLGHDASDDVGDRLAVSSEEAATPLLDKHNGAWWGVTAEGEWVFDLEKVHLGRLQPDGTEPAAGTSGAPGNFRVRLPQGAHLTLEIAAGATLDLASQADLATLTLGDGAVRAAVSEHLEALYAALKTYVESAQVLTALGVSGPILATSGPAPSWDARINSSKLRLPDT